MALLRLIHAAEMPDPSALAAMLAGGGAAAAAPRRPQRQRLRPQPKSSLPADFPALVDAVEAQGKQLLGVQLRDHVGLVSFAPRRTGPEAAEAARRRIRPRARRRRQAGHRPELGRSA